ncbi:MAG: carbohydrate kinase, partial [Gemmatimonadetes bacterium]|nr:carbohydrate kinase [Gemmatimonadota bacterium]
MVGVGDVLWDVFTDGERLGGAPANVAVHAAALGMPARLVSAVGRDARGRAAIAQLTAVGVDCDAVGTVDDLPTGTVHVTLDARGQPQFEIVRDVAWDAIVFDDAARRAVGDAGAVVYGTMGQRSSAGRRAIRAAVQGAPPDAWHLLDVNLRPLHHDDALIADSLAFANALKVNDEELPVVARACGIAAGTPRAQLRALVA